MCEIAARTACLGNPIYARVIPKWPSKIHQMVCNKAFLLHSHPHPTTTHTAAPATRRLCISALHSSSNSDGSTDRAKSRTPDMITFSSSSSTDISIYEPPGVSFDEYISDRPRVFRAMFPDEKRSKRLNNEEWRIQMLPIQFFFASVDPIVVMRLLHKSEGKEYPSVVPEHTTSILEIQATYWELRGLEGIHMPPHFSLDVRGVLYPARTNSRSSLKGHLQMSISMILPQFLKLMPEDVLKGVAEEVLRRLVAKMKQEVNDGLVSDFGRFRREKTMKHRLTTRPSQASSEIRGSS